MNPGAQRQVLFDGEHRLLPEQIGLQVVEWRETEFRVMTELDEEDKEGVKGSCETSGTESQSTTRLLEFFEPPIIINTLSESVKEEAATCAGDSPPWAISDGDGS